MRYIVSMKAVREAVGRTNPEEVFATLLDNKLIQSYRVDVVRDEVVVDADAGVEAAFIMAAQTEDTARPAGTLHTVSALDLASDARRSGHADDLRDRDAGRIHAEAASSYYSQAEAFTRSAAFRKLPERRRRIWRLHAQGLTKYEIAEALGYPSGAVARAILAVRPKAGLRRTTRTIPRGVQGKRTIT